MKKLLIILIVFCLPLAGCVKIAESESHETTEIIERVSEEENSDTEENSLGQEVKVNESTQCNSEQESQVLELTEEEYKELCREFYYDDFFKGNPTAGQSIKTFALVSEKYDYTSSSMQGILVEDITKEYGLELNCVACGIMHEETKGSIVPSYFGEHVFLMFIEDSDINIESFETGQKITIWGDIIQTQSGIFVLPKYAEEEKQNAEND